MGFDLNANACEPVKLATLIVWFGTNRRLSIAEQQNGRHWLGH